MLLYLHRYGQQCANNNRLLFAHRPFLEHAGHSLARCNGPVHCRPAGDIGIRWTLGRLSENQVEQRYYQNQHYHRISFDFWPTQSSCSLVIPTGSLRSVSQGHVHINASYQCIVSLRSAARAKYTAVLINFTSGSREDQGLVIERHSAAHMRKVT